MTDRGRPQILPWLLGALVLLGLPAALWAVSARGVSPEQRAADAEPPPAPVLEVAIEERVLSDVVVFRGVVVAEGDVTVMVPELGEMTPVVIDLPFDIGDEVGAATVVAVVSDRPVILVPMEAPLYRSLFPGAVGEDVVRLQEALLGMGYEVEIDGIFGSESQAAIQALYDDVGFVTAETSDELAEALRMAEEAVADARRDVSDARASGDSRSVSRANEALQAAEANRSRAADKVGVVVPLGEILGVSDLPAVVSSVEAAVGEIVDGPILVLTTSDISVEAAIDLSLAPLLAPGIEASGGDEGWSLVVASNDGRDDAGRAVLKLESAEPIPPKSLGRDIRIEAVLTATDGPVLAVPITAVRTGSSGEFIRVSDIDGVRDVLITPGVSIGGWVEIADSEIPLEPGTLARMG